MDGEKKELEKIKEKYQARNKYINNYMRNKYDRVVMLLPLGYKDKLNTAAKTGGFKSVNEFLKAVIDKELNQDTTPDGSQENNFLPFG